MENQEENPTPNSTKKVSMDGVFDELRSLLSDLGRDPSPPPPDELPIPPPPPQSFPPIEDPLSMSMPEPKPPEPPESQNVASDADFWSGNVLGWPSTQLPPSPLPEAPPPLPPATPLPAEPSYEKPALEGGPFSLDTPFLNGGPFLDQQAISKFENPLPPVPNPVTQYYPASPLDMGQVAPPGEPLPPAEPPIPIPGTLRIENAPPPPTSSEDPLNLEGTELKPSSLVQVACFFPEGQERPAQQFVSKLKELGEKSKSHLKVEPVFVSGWAEGKPDMTAWKKSAQLSGADIIFILGAKKDLEQLKSLPVEAGNETVRKRFVALEHLPLRTLYADIMIELERGR